MTGKGKDQCVATGCDKPIEDGFAFCLEHREAFDEECDELCAGAMDPRYEGEDE